MGNREQRESRELTGSRARRTPGVGDEWWSRGAGEVRGSGSSCPPQVELRVTFLRKKSRGREREFSPKSRE
ncbi:hypothetical protein CRG98_049442, partial [Punica granatum]